MNIESIAKDVRLCSPNNSVFLKSNLMGTWVYLQPLYFPGYVV